MTKHLGIRQDFTADFMSKPDDWRVSAVIHDGSWYTLSKWAKTAKVSEATLLEWIGENEDILITLDSSYRVSTDEVYRWYSTQDGFTIKDMIVPGNFPPRLWGGITEVEGFLRHKRRVVGQITFTCKESSLLKRVREILYGTARLIEISDYKYRAISLSPEFMVSLLERELTPEEVKSLDIRRRSNLIYRELSDLDPDFLTDLMAFYLDYSKIKLKPHRSTLDIYFSNIKELESEIATWVIEAVRKYDETKPVPFPGYLSELLRFRPYDVPVRLLGRELAVFQRDYSRARHILAKKKENLIFSNEEVAETMGYPLDKFVDLKTQHENWIATKSAESLIWEDSFREKKGVDPRPSSGGESLNGESEIRARQSSNIAIAALYAGMTTGEIKSCFNVIESLIGCTEDPPETSSAFRGVFKSEFKELESLYGERK